MSVGTEGSSPNPRTYSRAEYAALEAENARLVAEVEELDDLRKRQSELLSAAAIAIRGPEPALTRYSHADIPERVKMVVADRDAAIAQLAAIQGGMGEVVEVVGFAWLDTAHFRRKIPENCIPAHWNALMTVAQHQRITAAMAAEVERLRERYDCNTAIMHARTEALSRVTKECGALRAELAEVKGLEAVARVAIVPGTDFKSVDFFLDLQSLPVGTKLYTTQSASPDVEGLVKVLEEVECRNDNPARFDTEIDRIVTTALSTWRQAQEGKP